MRQHGWMSVLVTCGMVTGLSATAFGFDEQKIKPENLPKKVMAAAKKMFPDAKMIGAVKETDDDKKDEVLYVVEYKIDGKAIELAIDADGKIEAIEKEIDAADLPKAVTRAFAKQYPNGKITKVEEVTDEDDTVVYELDITNDGKKSEVIMAPNGKILDTEDDDDDKKKDKDQKKDKDSKKKDKKDDDNA